MNFICTKCNIEKDIQQFHKNKNNKTGYMYFCKECTVEKSKIYRQQNLEKCRNADKAQYYKNYDRHQEKNKRYREQNPDKIKKYYHERPEYKSKIQKEYRMKNKEKLLHAYAKRRALKKNICFNLKVEDIIIPEFCPVLGIKLNVCQAKEFSGKAHVQPGSPTIDKIKPELGYTKENIRVISHRANQLKNNATVEEIKLILEDLKKIYGEKQ